MKKLILILSIILISLSTYSQESMLSTIYKNWTQYNNYLTAGSTVKTRHSQEMLLQGISLYQGYVGGSLQGRIGIMDSCLTEFNTLYGKTHSAPTFTFSAASYFDLDSLYINGVKVESFYSRDTIEAWINEAGVDEAAVVALIAANAIDSTFLNTHLGTFRDSLDVTTDIQATVQGWISDSIATVATSTDSSWIQATVDTLNIGDVYELYDNVTSLFIRDKDNQSRSQFTHWYYGVGDYKSLFQTDVLYLSPHDGDNVYQEGVIYYDDSQKLIRYYDGTSWKDLDTTGSASTLDSTYVTLTLTDTLKIGSSYFRDGGSNNLWFGNEGGTNEMLFNDIAGIKLNSFGVHLTTATATSTAPNIIPFATDPNTGFTYVSSDKVGIAAGGVSTFTSEFNAGLATSITRVVDSLVVTGGISADNIEVTSITTGNGTHTNLVSVTTFPSDSAIIGITAGGVNFTVPLSDYTEAIYSPTIVDTSTTKQIKVYAQDGAYYDRWDITPDSVLTVTDSTTTLNITAIGTILVNDSEDCAIFGFSGGATGDIINIANTTTNNLVLKNNSTGTQKIMNGSDLTITGYGGATLLFNGTYWFIIGKNE